MAEYVAGGSGRSSSGSWTSRPAAIVENNDEWLRDLTAIELLRDVGKHFPMGWMLGKESVRSRMDGDGISYTEFSYMVLQAYDFLHLVAHARLPDPDRRQRPVRQHHRRHAS